MVPAMAMSIFVAGSVLIGVSIAILAIRQHHNPLSLPLALLAAGAALWGLPIGIGFYTDVLNHHQFLQRVRYLGTVIVPLAYYVVALRYAGFTQFVRKPVVAALSVIPALTLGFVWTSNHHDLVWRSVNVVNVGGMWTTTFEYGPWFGVHLVWTYALIVVALALLGWRVATASGQHRRQALFVFLAGAIPVVLNAMYFADIDTFGNLDMTPVAIGIGGAILGIGFLLFDLVDLRPVAQERLFEELRDGVIILNAVGQILEMNPVAREILHSHGVDYRQGTPFPDEFAKSDGQMIEATVSGEERSYQTKVSEFHDPGGQVTGRIIYLNDHTEIARREQQISVLHRILRHNIRNEMTILFGHLEYARANADHEIAHDLMIIEQSADRIMGFAENARIIERTLQRDDPPQIVNIEEAVRHAVAIVHGRLEELTVDIPDGELTGELTSVVDRELIEHAIAELIENAVIHGEGSIDIAVRVDDSTLELQIRNEGPGIPENEIDALEAPVETALEHGSGLGLWVARWTAELSGGDLSFGREGDTNIVSMCLPLVKSE